jgi:hypothetical protein
LGRNSPGASANTCANDILVVTSNSGADMEDRRSSLAGALVAVVLFMLALPVLYVLSIGPAAAIYQNRAAPEAVEGFYAPLQWVADSSEAARQALMWYVELWVDD